MTPPGSGGNFTGRNGMAYSTATAVESADVATAIKLGWTPADPGDVNVVMLTLPSGTTNNLAPIGFSTATKRLEITANSAGSTLTGLSAGAEDQQIMVVNLGTGALTLTAQSASSTAANRFLSNANATLAASGGSAILLYSTSQARWIVR